MAALAALELRTRYRWDNVWVTTFGEPRVGNAPLCRFIDSMFGLVDHDGPEGTYTCDNPDDWKYRRVTHKGDPVPLLPLGEWGYRSHAGELYITKPDLAPSLDDLLLCHGDSDPACSAGEDSYVQEQLSSDLNDAVVDNSDNGESADGGVNGHPTGLGGVPTRLKLWRLFTAHRDYFWRLGLCVPRGDPFDWVRDEHRQEL